MLVKQAICLVVGVISSYLCGVYIFESDKFEQYMNYMLKGYENPSAAMMGLIPELIVFINLGVSITVHLIAIFLYKLLSSTFISSLIKKIILTFSVLLFIGFCIMTIFKLSNVYEGYLFPSLIPSFCWIVYGCIILFTYFRLQDGSFNSEACKRQGV